VLYLRRIPALSPYPEALGLCYGTSAETAARVMTTVISEGHDGFKKAGVPEEDARAAAAALSTHERHFAELQQ
jgi:hypothetical protein